ncbi:MAG: helix-turn-helix domain-containing protein [Planctomycetes bacterium]|nr:helix-turn-helix domain-containing protein [Planctomycetota bacterium]
MPAQPNQSLADGVALLGVLCSRDGAIGSRELARLMGWEPTRANRLLGTLRDLGLAEQDAERRYRPGPGVHLLAAQCLHGSGLLTAALPVIRELRRQDLGFAVGVLWQGSVCYILRAMAGRPVEEGMHRANLYPAEQSSIGMVLEAASVGATRTPADEIAAIRGRGYAIQRNPGAQTGSVAVAIPGATAQSPPVAAIAAMADYAVHAPETLAALLRPAATAIAERLHRPATF